MYVPSPIPWTDGETLGEHLQSRGVSRRQFLQFCSGLAAIYGLNSLMAPQIARALQSIRRPSVVWLQLQECTGCVESVLRTAEPTIGNLVLDLISLDYSHTLMAAAGSAAEKALQDVADVTTPGNTSWLSPARFLWQQTGSTPPSADAPPRRSWRRPAKGAAAVIAIGACAHWGSVQAARPNPTGAVGVSRRHQGQAGGEHRRVPAHRRCGHRHHRALPDLQPPARDGRRKPAAVRLRSPDPRPVSPARQLRRRAVRRGVRRRGGAQGLVPLSRWAARARRPSRPAPSSSGTPAPAGPLAPAIRVSAAPSPTSGTPCRRSTPGCPMWADSAVEQRVDILGAALAVGAAAGVAAHAVATGVHQVRQRRRELPVVEAAAERRRRRG